MFVLVQALLLLAGIAAARLADTQYSCAVGPCPPIAEMPIATWSSPGPVRSDEFRLFAREERRPGQPGAAPIVFVRSDRVFFIGPASERLRPRLARPSQRELGVPEGSAAR